MRDEMDSRMWDAHHEAFSADLDRALRRFWAGFKRLNAIAYRAPWQVPWRSQRVRRPA